VKQALGMLVLLAAGAWLAHYHVANQHYFPVTRLVSSDGYTFHMVQDRVDTRSACGRANDRLVEPLKERCPQCRVAYARCERELQGLELQLLLGEPVPLHVVVAPGIRVAMEGPAATLRSDCESMAATVVRAGARSAACAYPGTMRRP
jgi:hypothetical protein